MTEGGGYFTGLSNRIMRKYLVTRDCSQSNPAVLDILTDSKTDSENPKFFLPCGLCFQGQLLFFLFFFFLIFKAFLEKTPYVLLDMCSLTLSVQILGQLW